jgi:hypothetical protein
LSFKAERPVFPGIFNKLRRREGNGRSGAMNRHLA